MPDTPSDPCPRTGGMPARLLRQGVQGRLCRASLPSQWRTELAVRTNPCGLRYPQNTRVRIYLDVLQHERIAESIHQWGSRSRNQPVSAHLRAGIQRDCEVFQRRCKVRRLLGSWTSISITTTTPRLALVHAPRKRAAGAGWASQRADLYVPVRPPRLSAASSAGGAQKAGTRTSQPGGTVPLHRRFHARSRSWLFFCLIAATMFCVTCGVSIPRRGR